MTSQNAPITTPVPVQALCEHDYAFDGESSDHKTADFYCVKCGATHTATASGQAAPSDESMMQALNLGTFTDRPLKDDEQVLVSWGTLKKALSRYGAQAANSPAALARVCDAEWDAALDEAARVLEESGAKLQQSLENRYDRDYWDAVDETVEAGQKAIRALKSTEPRKG